MRGAASHCYLVGEGTAWALFVPVLGGYIKTHWCVLVTTCPEPSCGALPGTPCTGAKRRTATAVTHHRRRALAQQMKKDDPSVRKKLLRAMPAVAFALDALEEAFGPEKPRKVVVTPVVGQRR